MEPSQWTYSERTDVELQDSYNNGQWDQQFTGKYDELGRMASSEFRWLDRNSGLMLYSYEWSCE